MLIGALAVGFGSGLVVPGFFCRGVDVARLPLVVVPGIAVVPLVFEGTVPVVVPVLVGGEMAGVAGADTPLETFEQLMREPLRGSGDVALVNGYDRVVVAADPLLRSGQKIDPAPYAEVRPLAGLPFRVVAGA